MKKYLFILATTAIVASCSDIYSLKEINTQGDGNEAISFETYSQKLTRAENSEANYSWAFYNHHGDFEVYGYKNPNTTAGTAVFDGQVIDAGAGGAFSYHTAAEARYWDKNTTTVYQFYAAAPHTNGGWTFNLPVADAASMNYDDQDDCYFTTTSTLSGVNLRNVTTGDNVPSTAAITEPTFKGTNDIDKLIAAPCSGSYTNFSVGATGNHTVQLQFIHILSKLNVTVKKDDTDANFAAKTVVLKNIKFYNLKNYGEFNENDAAADGSAMMDRWDAQDKVQVSSADVVYGYDAADVTLGTSPIYFVESLVIPQEVEAQTVNYDGTIPAVLYADETEYNEAKGTSLDAAAFAALTDAEKTKTAASAVSGTSEPYFVISYTIDGELFTSYHNLASAFVTTGESTLNFYEGFQNTLNINIKPERIDFSANVAAWADGSVNPASSNVE